MIITPNTEQLLLASAYNNAVWCDAICRDGGFTDQAWISPRPTPLYYPDAVTLTRDTDAAALIAGIDTAAPRASVKDSFAVLDLAPAGFEVLFDAQWIHRPAAAPGATPALEWSRITAAAELEAWETAWDGEESTGLFHPGLLPAAGEDAGEPGTPGTSPSSRAGTPRGGSSPGPPPTAPARSSGSPTCSAPTKPRTTRPGRAR